MSEEKYVLIEIKKLFNQLNRSNHNCLNTEINDRDLTTVQFMLLMYLLDNEDKEIFQRDIEMTFKVRRSTVTNLIKAIEEKGYIERQSVASDARLKQILLTDKAKEIGRRVFSDIHIVETKMKQDIDENKLKIFFEVMEMMNKNMEGR